MEWAMATRFQADRDLVVQSDLRAMPLDPSLAGSPTTAKIGFDLTLPFMGPNAKRSLEHCIPEPPQIGTQRFPSLLDALKDGPKHFADLMGASGSHDGREIVIWLEEEGAQHGVTRDNEGRYMLVSTR
jgi:3-polyprenyl-4-hydroxybenzoate decarboxylase